jgi:hypothetical protein
MPGWSRSHDRMLLIATLITVIVAAVLVGIVVSANNGRRGNGSAGARGSSGAQGSAGVPGEPGAAGSPDAAGFLPAVTANQDFTPYTKSTRGTAQPVGRLTSAGDEIVAVGAETGQAVPRAQFFVSANGGRSWALGTLTAAGGGSPPPGHAARFVAGGPGQWAAIGPDSVWISGTGRAWTLVSATGLPRLAGDRVTVLKQMRGGFIAAGANVPHGDQAKATPVVFLSASGTRWRRLGAGQLHLPAGQGRAADIRLVATRGNMIVIAGDIVMPPRTTHGRSKPSTAVRTGGAWLSEDGGRTWRQVSVPTGHGAQDHFTDAAATADGFVLVRSATVNGLPGADVYRSGNGTAWRFAATLTTSAGFVPGLMNSGPGGAVITGRSGRMLTAFLSRDGAAWRQTTTFGNAAETISGVAVSTTGAVIAAGTQATVPGGSQRLITVVAPAKAAPVRRVSSVSLTDIPGAVEPQLAVNAIAAHDGTQIVAGAANGFPAAWVTTDSGRTWRRAKGQTSTVLNRTGLQQLTGITHGAGGWLAVGGASQGTAGHPVVLASADGGVWSAADSEAAFSTAGLVTHGTTAGRGGFVIVGYQQVPRGAVIAGHTVTNSTRIAAAWWAAGLTGWHRASEAGPEASSVTGSKAGSEPGGTQMLAVTAAADGFVAVGSHGARPAVWASRDGRVWTRTDLEPPPDATGAVLEHVVAAGRTVVATGMARTAAGQAPFAARSADGGHSWTGSVLPVPAGTARVTAMATAARGFTVTGTFGTSPGQQDVVVWTSRNGTTWQAATPTGHGLTGAGIQEITGLTVSGRTLVGVGFTATPGGEQLTYWRSLTR